MCCELPADDSAGPGTVAMFLRGFSAHDSFTAFGFLTKIVELVIPWLFREKWGRGVCKNLLIYHFSLECLHPQSHCYFWAANVPKKLNYLSLHFEAPVINEDMGRLCQRRLS